MQRVAPGGLPKSRQTAQYLDLAAAVTSTPVPGTALNAVRGFASGALWSTSAGFSAFNNRQDLRARHAQGEATGANDVLNRVADGSSFAAGASDATSSVFSYFGTSSGWAATASTATAYASNAFWGVAGAIGTGQGVYNLFQSGKSKVASGLQVAGGLLNIAGAGFGAAAAQRQSADSNDPTAAYYGYASANVGLGQQGTEGADGDMAEPGFDRFAHIAQRTHVLRASVRYRDDAGDACLRADGARAAVDIGTGHRNPVARAGTVLWPVTGSRHELL